MRAAIGHNSCTWNYCPSHLSSRRDDIHVRLSCLLAQALMPLEAFSIVGPSVWNSLPSEIRSLPRDLSSSFYKLLKTFIFARAWALSSYLEVALYKFHR